MHILQTEVFIPPSPAHISHMESEIFFAYLSCAHLLHTSYAISAQILHHLLRTSHTRTNTHTDTHL